MTMGVWYPYCPCWMVISDTAIHMLTYPTQAISGGWTFYARLVMLTSLFLSFWVCVCAKPSPIPNKCGAMPASSGVLHTHAVPSGNHTWPHGNENPWFSHSNLSLGFSSSNGQPKQRPKRCKDAERWAPFQGFWRRYLPFYLLHISQDLPLFTTLSFLAGWWFGTFFIVHNIWDNPVILPIG